MHKSQSGLHWESEQLFFICTVKAHVEFPFPTIHCFPRCRKISRTGACASRSTGRRSLLPQSCAPWQRLQLQTSSLLCLSPSSSASVLRGKGLGLEGHSCCGLICGHTSSSKLCLPRSAQVTSVTGVWQAQ